jgi:hypothetical protein
MFNVFWRFTTAIIASRPILKSAVSRGARLLSAQVAQFLGGHRMPLAFLLSSVIARESDSFDLDYFHIENRSIESASLDKS